MFFAKPGEYEATGLYSIGHFILLIITTVVICVAIKFTKNKKDNEVKKIIQILTIVMWILEITKIIFNLAIGNGQNPNTYIPLYFCSLILYAGIFSGFCKGNLKKIGDVFIATGGLVAGIVFVLCPNTSLSTYPIFHFISLQSFILHGSMIYLGILVNITNYVDYNLKDIKYYAILIVAISAVAFIFNNIFDSNLMFISKDFPGTPIHILYTISGNLFTFLMIAIQATIPFYLMYFMWKFVPKKIKKIQLQNRNKIVT